MLKYKNNDWYIMSLQQIQSIVEKGMSQRTNN